jgi:hypothetical protein
MKISAQDPANDLPGADLPSRRTFLAGTATAAIAGMVGLGPISKVTADGKVVRLDPKQLATPMFTSTSLQLGAEAVVMGTARVDDLCPQIGLASVDPGMKYAPHMHDGYGLLVMLPGLKPVSGSRRTEPVEIHFDGARTMREFNKGGVAPPEGAREFVIFANGYATIPLFKDHSDPFVKSLYKALPDGGAAWLTRPNPPAWKNRPAPTPHPLDRATQARSSNGVTVYLCQLGPLAWSAEFDYYDPTPYVALVEFEPDATMPANWRNGWSGAGVIDGMVDVNGMKSTEGSFLLFEPLARQRFTAGPKGSSVIMFFDSGRAAFPVWEKPSDAAAIAFEKALRVPS